MRLEIVRNDASEPTMIIQDFTRRNYTIGMSSSLIAPKYKSFIGQILEVRQCNEVMDEEVAAKHQAELIVKYSNPDTNVVVISDSGDIGNTGIVEIAAVKVISYMTADNNDEPARYNTVAIYKKRARDDYVQAVLKLAYENEFGEGSYSGSI